MAAAYEIEAEIICAARFPPLQRAAAGELRDQSRYFGVRHDGELVATVETETREKCLVTIVGLAVVPRHFRKGLGTRLIRHVLQGHDRQCVEVSTARDNGPAISLYAKLGFQPVSDWITPDGYDMRSFQFDCLSEMRSIVERQSVR